MTNHQNNQAECVAEGPEFVGLFAEIVAAGIPYSSHESDLYLPNTPDVRRILAGYPLEKSNTTGFINRADPHKGEPWLDVPFAYAPFWDKS